MLLLSKFKLIGLDIILGVFLRNYLLLYVLIFVISPDVVEFYFGTDVSLFSLF